VMPDDFRRSEACICPGTGKGNAKTCFFRRFARRSRREETHSMSLAEFRLPAALKVRTIKLRGSCARRHCDLGPIWGRNTAEVEKAHTKERAQPISSL